MSEKKFSIKSTATELELYDEDIQIAEFPHYEWVAKSVDYIVDLLNELYEENKKLRNEIKCKDKIIELSYEMVGLNE